MILQALRTTLTNTLGQCIAMAQSSTGNMEASYEPQFYTLESKIQLFRIPVASDAGTAFQAIKNGEDKIK